MLKRDKKYLGAGIVFITPQEEILLLKKHNNKLTFPGGHREKQETVPYTTAIRECKEELGWIPKGNIIGELKIIKEKNSLSLYSFFMRVNTAFVPLLSEEHKDYLWVCYTKLKPQKLTSIFKTEWKTYKKYISTLLETPKAGQSTFSR